MLRRIYLTFGLSLFATNALYADIGGTVFQDLPVNGTSLNTYGVKDSNELGVSGITVTAYPDNISTVTASDGSWSLATTQDSRIEFSNFPNYLQESPNGSAIMFVANGAVANFGLHDPSNYSSTGTPNYVTNRQQNGSGEGNTNPAIETVNYTNTGLNQQFTDSTGTQGTGPIPSKDSEIQEVGSIWGKAYQKDQKRLFASSVLQRHIGFAPNKGAGDVYVLDYSAGTPATFLGSFSLQGVTPNNGGSAIDLGEVCRSTLCKDDVGHTGIASDYVLNPSPATPNIDLDAFTKIGKMSYGDIDFEQSTNTLWLINLNQKGIISVDASGDFSSLPSTVNQYLIEDLNNAPTCIGGELRPWALTIHQGRGYLGAVCDALTSQNSADMQAYVLSFDTSDPAAGFKEELSFPLNYDKDGGDWNPWSDTDQKSGTGYWLSYYQPILSDIEFDASNTMYLSFLDRYGLQAGFVNYEPISGTTTTNERAQSQGELLRACFNLGNYELEGTGSCTQTNYGNEFLNDRGGDNAPDYANGTLALLKGSNQIVVGVIDPHPEGSVGQTYWNTMGANILSTQNGSIQNWYSNIHTNDANNGYNGKSQGMGDIELLTDAAPIEVGDRVWEDTNSNGVQDYDESGLVGISVELVCGGVVSSTATTDVNGNYIFSSDPIPASTASHKYNVTDLVAGTNSCLIRVPNVVGTSKQATLGIATLTVANSGEGVNANSNDSDGLLVGDNAEATVLASDIPISGANNHAFDFGFSPKPVVSIGSLIWEDLNKNGLQDDTELGIKDVNVTLLDENGTVMSPPAMQTTGVDGQYYFSGLNEGDYSILVSPPSGMGYVPCVQQTTADNDDTENDSNIKSSSGNEYTSGKFTLQADTEPSESNGMSGTDGADDSDDDNGNMTVDFCFYRPASLGDYVWYDENKDGIQDAGEHGVKDITVKLLKDCNDATVVGTTTTDNDGKYLFSDLDVGDYCVEFSNLPADTMVTTKGVGTATDDSDASTTAPFKTDMITLSVGQEDFTWDMGIYSSLVAIGDRVWYDLNKNGQQDVGESGVKDIAVKLLDATCTNELNTTTTDGTGNYIFDYLREGTYCLEFGTLPDSYVITTQDAIGSDEEDSDVNASTHKTIPVTLSNGARDLTWDMGIYAPASLGDRVWNDSNANGVQDAGEVGVENVVVTLLGSDCATAVAGVEPQTTDVNGNYLFSDLIAGDYCVAFTNLPAGFAISPANQGDDATDSDVNVSTGKTEVTTLDAGENDPTWDMGIYEEASIGNYVWNDANANGEQEAGELGVESVTVTLYGADCITVAKDSLGVNISAVQTDVNGNYIFEHLMPAEYCLGFSTLPAGFGATFADRVADDSDSDANVTTLKTIATVLDAGEADMSWDMGIFQAASIGDTVWYDNNVNGIQDANESGVENVSVHLYQSDCSTVALDGMGVAIPSTTTDANGKYAFNSLVPNNYCVGFDITTLPAGYKVTSKNVVGSTAENNSDADMTGLTQSTELIGGENDLTWDMGIYAPASLGDRVWNDSNANGVQDAGEVGVENVVVTLYEADCATAVSVDSDGVAITPVQTDADGNYNFINLVPSEYCVGFELPVGYVVSPMNNGANDGEDSDVNPASLRTASTLLISGEQDTTWDMGIYQPASIGDVVWLDNNGDGIQDSNESGVENVTVTLYRADCTTAVTTDDSGVAIVPVQTDATGHYNFVNLTPAQYCIGFELPVGYEVSVQDQGGDDVSDSDVDPVTQKTVATTLISGENDTTWDMGIYKPATIGNVVWNDLNANGIQDTGEMGVADVNVTLYNCDCITPATNKDGVTIPSVVTDGNGMYAFTALQPNDYCLGFTLPTGYSVSVQSATSDDTRDSDVNPTTKKTECTTLSSDENDSTWDMGIYQSASIGDKVWLDDNRDGIQDTNEKGVAGVAVTLYEVDCTTAIKTMNTNTVGDYLFDGLVPNDYCIGFEAPQGYALTSKDTTDDSKDSDVNPDTGKTVVTSLESGEADMRWDAGIYQLSSIGDKVWYDNNHNGIQDADEPAVKNVRVSLYRSDCETVITQTYSDVNGIYRFTNLEPNQYCVGFDALPIGYQFTPTYDNTGAGSELDCNVDPGTGKTPVITLPHSTNDMTWDMGIIPKCKDELDRNLLVFDDEIIASTTGSVTRINILDNDYGNLDIESIKFVSTIEGEVIWNEGTAVAGTSAALDDTLVVPGEGVWHAMRDGTITFEAEDGFTGIPSPVYYVVNCKQGSTSNIAQVKITTNCTCDTYEQSVSDSVPTLDFLSMLWTLFVISGLGIFFAKKELEAK